MHVHTHIVNILWWEIVPECGFDYNSIINKKKRVNIFIMLPRNYRRFGDRFNQNAFEARQV